MARQASNVHEDVKAAAATTEFRSAELLESAYREACRRGVYDRSIGAAWSSRVSHLLGPPSRGTTLQRRWLCGLLTVGVEVVIWFLLLHVFSLPPTSTRSAGDYFRVVNDAPTQSGSDSGWVAWTCFSTWTSVYVLGPITGVGHTWVYVQILLGTMSALKSPFCSCQLLRSVGPHWRNEQWSHGPPVLLPPGTS